MNVIFNWEAPTTREDGSEVVVSEYDWSYSINGGGPVNGNTTNTTITIAANNGDDVLVSITAIGPLGLASSPSSLSFTIDESRPSPVKNLRYTLSS